MLKFVLGGGRGVGRLGALSKMASGYLGRNLLGQNRVQYIEIMTTYACNADCMHCSNEKYTKKARSQLLSPAKVRNLIDQAANMGVPVVVFLGGEPLLDPNLYDYVRYTAEKGMLPNIASNGQLFDRERLIRLRENNVHTCYITIYSSDSQENERMVRLPGYLEKALATIDLGRELGVQMALKTVVTRSHFLNGEVDRIVALAKSKGVPLSINPIVPTGAAFDNFYDEILTPEMQQRLDQIVCDNPGVTTHLTSNYFGYGCPAGKAYMGVTPYGDVLACYFLPISFGNVWKDGLPAIQERLLKTRFLDSPCHECFAAYNRKMISEVISPCFANKGGALPMNLEDHPLYCKVTDSLDFELGSRAGATQTKEPV